MTMEEDVTYASGGGTVVDETRYLLGARGIERLEAQRMASPLPNDPLTTAKRSYPLYDGHGNPDSPRRGGAHFPSAGLKRMIETLGRTATGYTIANEKKYDVWGAVRQSQSPGSHVVNPNKQYCANLGHTFDGESELIYVRARYYEPATGRFISEDPACQGTNWYVYCGNGQTRYADESGRSFEDTQNLWTNRFQNNLALFGILVVLLMEAWHPQDPYFRAFKNFIAATIVAIDAVGELLKALESDKRSPSAELTVIGYLVISSLILMLAVRQLMMMLVMTWNPDQAEGYIDGWIDFHPDKDRRF